MSHMKVLSFALALACSSLGLVSFACSSKTSPAMAAERSQDSIRLEPGSARLKFIKIAKVEETEAAPSVRLTGKIGFNEDATQRVASPIDGRASRILVELGDHVRAGQPLLELTSPHVSELQADAQKARQDLDVATKGLERTRKLKLDGAVSEKEAAQAEADFRKTKADAARTEAQLRSLSVSPTDPATSAALRAQIGGIVVERNVLVGQEVRADSAQPLFTISNLDTVWVQADVYEQDLGLVHKGDAVRVHVPAYPNDTFEGKVDHIGDVLDPASRTVKLRCSVPNKDHMLKPEMFAKIELTEAAGKKAIILPASAILTDSEHTRVFVAGGDNVFRPRVVTIGPEFDGSVRVLSGLAIGEQVVTEGAIFLKRELESGA
jgi:cobalt-zinc-cadmium efflux system membrane fusion protein